MKKCPYCAEEIQDAAIKCKHCGERVDAPSVRPVGKEGKGDWYFRPSFIALAVCTVGPLALPLVWLRPNMSRAWKAGLTVAILAVSWLAYRSTVASIHSIMEYYKFLDAL